MSFSQANVSIGRTQKWPDPGPVRSPRLLIHCRHTSFCLYVCSRNKAAHKKQNFEAALYVVMYSLCSGGMNNSPCHTKSHWESDICRLVCFSSALLLMRASEPCSHMFHCLSCASVETYLTKILKSRTNYAYFVTDNCTSSFPEEMCADNLLVFKYSDSFVNHPQ